MRRRSNDRLWLGVFPGLFIMITVLSINFVGDALRDLLDVRETKDLGRTEPPAGPRRTANRG